MSTAALNLPYTPQLDSGAIRSFVFAVMVHGALFGFLYFGVRWQSETPTPIEAELWTALPSAPAPVPKAEAPRAEVKPEPKPEVKEVPVVKPDIAVKDEKKDAKKNPEPKPKVQYDPITRDLMKEQFAKELQRDAVAQAANKETASASSRENQNWQRAINAHIKRNFVFADTSVNPNLEARFEIRLAQSLRILDIRLIKPSGNPAFDAAAQSALQSTVGSSIPPPPENYPDLGVGS